MNTRKTMPTRKINNGLYEFTYKGRTFQIENIHTASDGELAHGWNAFEMNRHGGRDYLMDYNTKRTAIVRTIEAVDEGF